MNKTSEDIYKTLLRADGFTEDEIRDKLAQLRRPISTVIERKMGTTSDAAAILAVTTRTIRRYAAKGVLSKSVINSRRTLYDLNEARRLAEGEREVSNGKH